MMRHTLLILMLLVCGMSASAQLTLKSEKGDFEARLVGRYLTEGCFLVIKRLWEMRLRYMMSVWGRWFVS